MSQKPTALEWLKQNGVKIDILQASRLVCIQLDTPNGLKHHMLDASELKQFIQKLESMAFYIRDRN